MRIERGVSTMRSSMITHHYGRWFIVATIPARYCTANPQEARFGTIAHYARKRIVLIKLEVEYYVKNTNKELKVSY